MTPEERSLLTQFLADLDKTRGVAREPEAAQMIDQAFRSNPDAAYVLVQHALLADQALHQAQAQIADLQAQLQRAQPAPQPSSFLGGAGLGPRVAQPGSPWAQAAQQPPPQGGFFGGGPFSGQQSGLGSFLQQAGTTAAGVAGGAFLFEGLSNLFGGHRGFGGGYGGGWGGPTENVTINNYGDSSDDGYDPGTSDDIGGDDYS